MNIGQLEALAIISRLPDDCLLTTEEAACALRVSVTTLERWRSPDSTTEGPPYIQAGGKTDAVGKKVRAAGANQKILYKKGDLSAWAEKHRVSNSMEAAVRKGQMFRTLADLVEPAAFWRNQKREIAGLVDETSLDVFLARLGKWEIEWIEPAEAAAGDWESLASQNTFASAVTEVLSMQQKMIAAALEAIELKDLIKDDPRPIVEKPRWP